MTSMQSGRDEGQGSRSGERAVDSGVDPEALERLAQAESALEVGQVEQALDALRAALASVETDSRIHARIQARMALTLARSGHPFEQARSLCEQAMRRAGDDPEPYLDLARIYLGVGRRAEALRFLRRGRMVDPSHPVLARMLAELGTRRSPMIPFLPRRHPLNRWLGGLQARFRDRPASRNRADLPG